MTSPTKLCMIIRNILVVLVIYDYFSVVVCECQRPISVPSCPKSSHAWSLKAEDRCTMKDKYHCLITENHNEDKSDLIECCMPYQNVSRGHMPRYNTIKKTIQEVACDNGYYMNNTFASNKYRRYGVEHCNDKKSACVDMKGMKIYDNGSTMEDRKCYCDYENNFKPYFTLDPNVVYFYDKDNYCIPSGCDLEFQELNMMYQCVNVCKDGEYRPEKSMDCIPKSSTTTPPVEVSINGSTETTTKYTPEDTIETTETTDYKVILIPVVFVVVVILAIICYVIKKTCKDGNGIHCCVYERNGNNCVCCGKIINLTADNIVSGNENKVQVNDSPLNSEKVPLIEVIVDPEEKVPLIKMENTVPIIELKGHTFNVDEGKSVAIECTIIDEEKYGPPFWERINEDDETNILTIREDKKDKYLGLKSDPPYYLRILNAEMSDRGYYRCCIEYSTSNGEQTMRSKKAHLMVEKALKPGDTLIDQQTNIKVNTVNADKITIGDGTLITVNNSSEDKNEKTNTSISSSSSSSSSENASSSKNETSENFDKMEKGTQNSDCGQEPGDVDINKEKKSKMNPVPATEQGGDEKNINENSINEDTEEKMKTLKGSNPLSEKNMSNNCDEIEKGTHNSDSGHETGDNGINKEEKSNIKPVVTEKKNISEIETIAAERGYSVKNVLGDGNCMFHAIALQLLDNKLKNKIGEEKSKELRYRIVEFLKNNDTTPTGEKYSSFLSGVGENNREIKWSTYLTSMSKPGHFGDEIILRAVSHCFNVRIRVLSTANPEFIDYNSPDNSNSSTVYLGFIDKSLHYVRLQPKSTGNHKPNTSVNESSV